mgnify:FL=1
MTTRRRLSLWGQMGWGDLTRLPCALFDHRWITTKPGNQWCRRCGVLTYDPKEDR